MPGVNSSSIDGFFNNTNNYSDAKFIKIKSPVKQVLLIRLFGLLDKIFLDIDPTIGFFLNKINFNVEENFQLKCLNTSVSENYISGTENKIFANDPENPTSKSTNVIFPDFLMHPTQSNDKSGRLDNTFDNNIFVSHSTTYLDDSVGLEEAKNDDTVQSTITMVTSRGANPNAATETTSTDAVSNERTDEPSITDISTPDGLSHSDDIYSFYLTVLKCVGLFLK